MNFKNFNEFQMISIFYIISLWKKIKNKVEGYFQMIITKLTKWKGKRIPVNREKGLNTCRKIFLEIF